MDSKARDRISKLIKKGIRRYKIAYYIGLILGLILGPGVVLAYIFIDLNEVFPGEDQSVYMLVFGIVFSVLFLVMVYEQSKRVSKYGRLIQAINGVGNKLVWVYKMVSHASYGSTPATAYRVATFNFAVLALQDGTILEIGLPEQEVEELLHLISQNFSDISVGYSKDWERLYKDDPKVFSSEIRGEKVEASKEFHGKNVVV